MSLKSVKSKIRSIDKTRQVTKAMEIVSSVKMRKAQHHALSLRGHARSALRVLQGVSGAIDAKRHPLFAIRPVRQVGIIVVSADKGLAGSFVSNLLKASLTAVEETGLSKEHIRIYAIGKKASEFFQKRGFTVASTYDQWGDAMHFDEVSPLLTLAQHEFSNRLVDQIYLIYTNFHSTVKQEAVVRTLLPVDQKSIEAVVEGIAPENGKFADPRGGKRMPVPHYSFEPSPKAVLDVVLPLLLQIELYHAVLESNASEHSARMIAMKNASDNARDISKHLRLRYNNVRQASITREVSEIVGGMESMNVT